MDNLFFERPILNSPYSYPGRHWELDKSGQPTGKVLDRRREASYITPIPKPKKVTNAPQQTSLILDEGAGISTADQEYDPTPIINALRVEVDRWRAEREQRPSGWRVSPETRALLKHWYNHEFSNQRPFFCQVEAAETLIWLTEVAPETKAGRVFLDHLKRVNEGANPDLLRIALKLATGAGKTTVMAMIIAWHTINAARHPQSQKFTRGFLVVTPGITIKDRLRVLQPNDPDSYYLSREMVPDGMRDEIQRARIVITNYHAFRRRETLDVASGTRALLKGRRGDPLETLESEGEMLRRVMPELMGEKRILILNDEAHHCYREKPGAKSEEDYRGQERKEAEKNREAARLWIGGLEAANRHIGLLNVVDLSATPFFLRGSGYREGTLFPWTMSDFSLMDAIECGIVKLPRVPVAQNLAGGDLPMFRDLWENIRKEMPKKGRGGGDTLNPQELPTKLITALEALYGHYQKTYALWEQEGVEVPPCFILVCQNTAISKLIYDFISGYQWPGPGGEPILHNGRLPLFRNFDDHGNPLARPRTLLIDSEQLDSGEALADDFRAAAGDEIARFRREALERGGRAAAALREGKVVDDAALLREVMNTVGRKGQLGESIRCVVSVSMLTEGWDANTVTHVLGIRAFGTQLLCEQVVGRALRRQSYQLNEEGLFNVEYADVLGIPFDFNAKPVIAPPQPPRETVLITAMRPDRDALEIRYPRVVGYRVELPEERLRARFTPDSTFQLTQALVGPTLTRNEGILGEGIDLRAFDVTGVRQATLEYHLARWLMLRHWTDADGQPRLHLFGQLKRITREWLESGYLECIGGTHLGYLLHQELADRACQKITAAINLEHARDRAITAMLDPYNPIGSTAHVLFPTSKKTLWKSDPNKCHINWVVTDSEWEAQFCLWAEQHPRVRAYVKNHNLGFEVPYRFGSENRHYRPDFILVVNDRDDKNDLLNLVVEIKGQVTDETNAKKAAMQAHWVPGVNRLQTYGRWAFVELRDVFEMEKELDEEIARYIAAGLADMAEGMQ